MDFAGEIKIRITVDISTVKSKSVTKSVITKSYIENLDKLGSRDLFLT